MKDPCDKCLVRVTCSKECPEKRNYATLLLNAIRNFQHGNMLPRYSEQFNHYLKLTNKHILRRNAINMRARLISK